MPRSLRLLGVFGLAGAALAACSPTTTSHDKAYYAAHAADRAATLAACQNDPGRRAATPDCVNAQAADADAHAQHFYDTPTPAARVDQPGKL
jgi:hypothetical protein